MEPIELEMDSVIELAVGLNEQEWEQFEELIISEAENLPTDDNGDVDAEAVGEQVVNRLCTDPALEPFLRRLITGLVDEALWEIADRQSEHEHEHEDGGGQDS
jgi:hypothetical protein